MKDRDREEDRERENGTNGDDRKGMDYVDAIAMAYANVFSSPN